MADMGLGMMGAAAGAGDGIAQLFDERLKAAQLGQQDALTRLKVQEVADARAETIKQREESATQRAQDQATREQDRADQRAVIGAQMRPSGASVTPEEMGRETAAGVPSSLYKIGPGPVPVMGIAPPPALASPTDSGQPDAIPGTIANSPSPAATAPAGITFTGTQAQQERTAANQQKLSDATTKADQAWERLRQQGQTQDAMSAFHESQIQLAQAKLAAERAQHDAAASKTPQPQFFTDGAGNTHAVIFDKGALTEVPLPAGYTPTKAAPPGLFDRVSHWFGGGATSPNAPMRKAIPGHPGQFATSTDGGTTWKAE